MIKYSIKLLLWKHNPAANGKYPIYIKTTINRRTSYKATGQLVAKNEWDEVNERLKVGGNANLINARLTTIKNELEEKIITTQLKGIDISEWDFKRSFKTDYSNIFEYVDDVMTRGKKSSSTYDNYAKHLKKLETFNGSRSLTFESINVRFLQQYEEWLRKNINFKKPGDQKNYIHAIWKTLKTWFNSARREGLITNYPFDKYENPVYISPDKDFLNLKELADIETFADTCTNAVLREVAIYFLFGCYSGLRLSDWFQFDAAKHVEGNVLRLRPMKTKNKWVEMIMSRPLERNLKRMQKVPLTLAEPTINEKLKIIAKKLGINKHLTTHSGRHTFAVTICLGNKLSSETAAELMGITLQTFVSNYSQITQQKINAETVEAWEGLQ